MEIGIDISANAHAVVEAMQTISMLAAGVIGLIGVAIMGYGTVKGFIWFILSAKRMEDDLTEIRIDIAKHLSLGLEFLVGKDIIETIIRPSMEQLFILLFIIVIRTFIAYILAQEVKGAIEEIEEEKHLEEALMEYERIRNKHHNRHNGKKSSE